MSSHAVIRVSSFEVRKVVHFAVSEQLFDELICRFNTSCFGFPMHNSELALS